MVKTNKILISLPDSYLKPLDSYVEDSGLGRSDIIRRALDLLFTQVGISK